MAIKGILFDFNGTLFFDSKHHIRAFKEEYKKHGLHVRDDEYIIRNIFGRSNDTIFRQEYKPGATDAECVNFMREKEEFYIKSCTDEGNLRLAEGVPEMLDYLKEKGIPYCMATGSERVNVEFYFERLGIGRWFSYDNIVYTDGTFRGKPYPDIYLLEASRLGLKMSECLVFEDGTSGIKAAMAAGAGAIVAVYSPELPSPLNEDLVVDAVFHSFADYGKILAGYGL